MVFLEKRKIVREIDKAQKKLNLGKISDENKEQLLLSLQIRFRQLNYISVRKIFF